MKIELNKKELISLVGTTSPSSINECLELVKEEKMMQTGNQHNYGWSWKKEYLESLSEGSLLTLYNKYKS